MARRKRKRRFLRLTFLLGIAGGVAAFLRNQAGGGEAAPQTFSDAARPTGQEERPTPAEGTSEVVKPDDSEGDPLVEEQTAKAEAEAGAVGGNVQEMAEEEAGLPSDPEMRPVIDGSGDDAEAAEQADAELGGNRERRP